MRDFALQLMAYMKWGFVLTFRILFELTFELFGLNGYNLYRNIKSVSLIGTN